MEIIINQVSFSLPCKAFIVDYSVSQKRQLPVVKEFMVRLLFSVGSCNPKLLSGFFGFNIDELQYVLNDLAEERLIEWDGEEVVLTKYAKERFEEIPGGKLVPRFFEIEDEIRKVLFDICSFKILYSSLKPESRNPLGVDIPLKLHSNIKEIIKSSFDEQFSIFQEKVQNKDIFKEHHELYKINHITTVYDVILPIEVNYSIHKDNPRNIILRYNSESIDDWDNQRSLFKAMDDALYQEVHTDGNQSKDFSEYLDVTSDPFIAKYWLSDEINIDILINNYTMEHNIWDSKSTRMLIGNIYTEKNQSIIMEMINEKRKNDNELRNKITTHGAIWIIEPTNKTWGKSKNFISFTENISKMFDQRKKSTGIAMLIHCSSKQEAWELDSYSFATKNMLKLQGINEYFISEKIEIFFIPNVIFVSLFHYNTDDNRKLTLPIGFITTNNDRMDKINTIIKHWLSIEGRMNAFFEFMNKDKKNKVIDSIILPTVEIQSDIKKS